MSTVNRTVNDGSEAGKICPQGYPEWTVVRNAARSGRSPAQLRQELESDPRQSEDCLFLDVVVPKSVFEENTCQEGKALGKGGERETTVKTTICSQHTTREKGYHFHWLTCDSLTATH